MFCFLCGEGQNKMINITSRYFGLRMSKKTDVHHTTTKVSTKI